MYKKKEKLIQTKKWVWQLCVFYMINVIALVFNVNVPLQDLQE